MNSLNKEEEEETYPLLSISSSHTTVRDNRTPRQKQLAVYLILASLLFESFGFYTVIANLIPSMTPNTPRTWEAANVLIASFIFTGTTYFSTLLFAVVSDAKLGRAKTILFGFVVYVIGYALAAVITYPNMTRRICTIENETDSSLTLPISQEHCSQWILSTLIIIAIGAGAVQSNMAVLGAVQMQEFTIRSSYFDKYLVTVNIGALTARLVSSFIDNGETYFTVCLVAAISLAIAAVLFFSGWRYYIDAKPYDSVITMCIPVVINAHQTRRQYRKQRGSIAGQSIDAASFNMVDTIHDPTEENKTIREDQYAPTFLDFAKVPNGGKFHERIVNDVGSLRNAFIVFAFLIPYFIIYNQLYAGFPLQGQQMNTLSQPRLVNWMSLSEPITVIIGILMLNTFLYKFLNRRNRSLSITTKIMIGMICACISMCFAGSVEVLREIRCPDSNITTSTNGSSNLSIFAQLPQNIALGFSEILAVMASYEFAFYAAPRSAQSLFMSLRFCSSGVASFIGAAYTATFSKGTHYITSNFSCHDLSNRKYLVLTYFYRCAVLQLFFLLLFIRYQRKRRTPVTNR